MRCSLLVIEPQDSYRLQHETVCELPYEEESVNLNIDAKSQIKLGKLHVKTCVHVKVGDGMSYINGNIQTFCHFKSISSNICSKK